MNHQDSHDQSLLLLVTLGIDYIYYIDFQQEKMGPARWATLAPFGNS
jgi:hypothetical protein